jgi:hypothetical protein
VAALMARRLAAKAGDSRPMLLAFLTRALLDTAFNTWYDRETEDLTSLVDGLMSQLRGFIAPSGAPAGAPRRPSTASRIARR